jgi:hypothetical protein
MVICSKLSRLKKGNVRVHWKQFFLSKDKCYINIKHMHWNNMPTGAEVVPGGGAEGAAELGEMRHHGGSRIMIEGGGT